MRFVCTSSVTHDGVEYKAGEVVELTESQGALLLHAVAPAPVEEKSDEKPAKKSGK